MNQFYQFKYPSDIFMVEDICLINYLIEKTNKKLKDND